MVNTNTSSKIYYTLKIKNYNKTKIQYLKTMIGKGMIWTLIYKQSGGNNICENKIM